MKLTPLAAASLLPATLAGIAFSIMPFVNGSSATVLTAHTSGRSAAHTVGHVRPSAHHTARQTTATATAATKRTAVPTQPAGSQPATGSLGASGAGSATATSGQPITAGMSAFEQCVAWRESSDTPTDPDGLFGILPSVWAQLGYSGTAGQASVAQQMVAFSRLYAEYGTQPWAPSDGC